MKTLLARIAAFVVILFVSLAGLFLPSEEVTSQPPGPKPPKREMENLGRGGGIMKQGCGKIFVSWCMLGTDPDNIAIWWDGGLLRCRLDGNRNFRWDWMQQTLETILTAVGCLSNKGSTPLCLAGMSDRRSGGKDEMSSNTM